MGNVLKAVPGGGGELDDIDKTLKNNPRVSANCVFPIDRILSQLVSVAPASCLGILLFFSSSGRVLKFKLTKK